MDRNSPDFWHQRFKQQAGWTAGVRRYLLNQLNLALGKRVLEVGCGTGAVIEDISQSIHVEIYGIDIHFPFVSFAKSNHPSIHYLQGDGLAMPFPSQIFDLVFCHFYILWISDPRRALKEMVRVTRKNGVVAALAEPDYGGRIDYPSALENIGRLQENSLNQQGANTRIGRQLKGLFYQAGLTAVHIGVLGGEWDSAPDRHTWELEWHVLEYDLQGMDKATIDSYRKIDFEAWKNNERVLYTPTFYAWGKVI